MKVSQFNKTPWYLSDKSFSIGFNKSSLMTLHFSLYLLKAFEIGIYLKHTSSWTYISPRIKPDRCRERTLFSLKYVNKSLKILCSSTLPPIGSLSPFYYLLNWKIIFMFLSHFKLKQSFLYSIGLEIFQFPGSFQIEVLMVLKLI